MSKKYLSRYFKIIGAILVFCFYLDTSLALVISEINFDPAGTDTDREWVEIFNDTNLPIDLTTYKFFEGNVNHNISVLSGDKNINSGEYVVLVQDLNKFKTDFPAYTGKIFKASFSLNNSGELIALKDVNGNIVNSVSYSPSSTGAGNGLTINFDGTNYAKGSATPGVGNLIIGVTSSNDTTSTSTATTTSTTSTTTDTSSWSAPVYFYRSYWPEENKVYLYAGENKVGLSGGDIFFQANAQTGDKKNISDNAANYFWSFGDGAEAQGKTVQHVYKFPGEYVVNVQAYANGNMGEDKIYVEIFDPSIKITLQKIKDLPAVQISNNSNNEIDIGNYLLDTDGPDQKKTFTLPKKLNILPKKSILISQDVINFATTTEIISLDYPNGKIISQFQTPSAAPVSFGATPLSKGGIVQKSASSTSATTTGLLGVFTKDEFEKIKIASTSTSTSLNLSLQRRETGQKNTKVLMHYTPPTQGSEDGVSTTTPTIVATFQIQHEKSLVEKALSFFGI